MRKIDLHIHTVASVSDSAFTFSLENLQKYVSTAQVDAIAITNHDLFDKAQYLSIKSAIDATVFPGIEITLRTGHVLIIDSGNTLDDFDQKCSQISQLVNAADDTVSIRQLIDAFDDLSKYLVIPHYEKKPAVHSDELAALMPYVSAGEVDSPKKFIRTFKDESKLCPVLFSDCRISEALDTFPTRQTYIDCGEITLNAVKLCFQDRHKIALSPSDGNRLFQIFDNGQQLSTGLNILMGARSSGKTHTLETIHELGNSIKYIKQFELVQQDSEDNERKFSQELSRKRSVYRDDYLRSFQNILNDVMGVDLRLDEQSVEQYITSLLRSAEEAEKKDSFSRTSLFDESEFPTKADDVLDDLIHAVRQLIENIEYRSVIDKHLDTNSLKALACELIEILHNKDRDRKIKTYVNSIVRDVKDGLKLRTSATAVSDVDLYRILINQKKVERFEEVVRALQTEAVIHTETIQDFSVVTRKSPFSGPGEIKAVSGIKVAFSESFKDYGTPYRYLRTLMQNDALTRSELYKYFAKVDYKILNRDGYEVSGGERSEFRLLEEIKDSQNYDMLLIDEPESSFDNLFLREDVNQMLKEIAATMPVIVVTHNSTVGASIEPDYLLYAQKEQSADGVTYKLFSGYPTDQKLRSVDNEDIDNFTVTLDALEAGTDAYETRRERYETIKNRRE